MKNLGESRRGGKDEAEIIPQKIAALGPLVGDAVFLPCNNGKGGKGPILTGWPKLTIADMTPQHIEQCERPEYRIGISHGVNSSGLNGLDADCEAFEMEMLCLNRWLARTLTTTCNRGCCYWLRIVGFWPRSTDLWWRGERVGEWRADGNQTVISGQDPDTKNFRRFVVRAPVLSVSFQAVIFPDGMESGGEVNRMPWPPSESDSFQWRCLPADTLSPPRHKTVEQDSRTKLRSTVLPARSTAKGEAADIQRAQKRLYREHVASLRAVSGQRNALLRSAVPYLVHVVCEKLAVEFLLRHFDEIGKAAGWRATRAEHEECIRSLVAGTLRNYPEKLAPVERVKYEKLGDDEERAAFRIGRDLAARNSPDLDCPPGLFLLSRPELAARLGLSSFSRARAILARFASLHIIEVERAGLPRARGQRGLATRFRWVLSMRADGAF
jgi:hypothetical protein